MKPWTIPRCFVGETVVILANGPSMSAVVADQVCAAGLPAIAVNNAFRLAPWAWALYAGDSEWWNHHSNGDARNFEGIKVCARPVQGLNIIRTEKGAGWTDALDCVHTYSHSGAQAIQIAAKAGAARVLLVGYDMQGSHWHGRHPEGLRNTEPEVYSRWIAEMAQMPLHLRARGIEVVNCTPGSALQCFPFSPLETELAAATAQPVPLLAAP